MPHFIRWSLSRIANREDNGCVGSGGQRINVLGINREISSQLPFRSILSASYQVLSGDSDQESNYDKQRFAGSKPQEILFGSLLITLVWVWIGWRVGVKRPIYGGIIILYALISMMGGFDLFSIYLRLV